MSCSDNEDGVETVGIDPDDEVEEEEVAEVEEIMDDADEVPQEGFFFFPRLSRAAPWLYFINIF